MTETACSFYQTLDHFRCLFLLKILVPLKIAWVCESAEGHIKY